MLTSFYIFFPQILSTVYNDQDLKQPTSVAQDKCERLSKELEPTPSQSPRITISRTCYYKINLKPTVSASVYLLAFYLSNYSEIQAKVIEYMYTNVSMKNQ